MEVDTELIVGESGYWETNPLLNLINHEPDINKIYLYAKDLYEQIIDY